MTNIKQQTSDIINEDKKNNKNDSKVYEELKENYSNRSETNVTSDDKFSKDNLNKDKENQIKK